MFESGSLKSVEALKIFADLPEVLQAYMTGRAGEYGIPAHELLQKMPQMLLDNPVEIFKFLKSKHISHLKAISEGGSENSFWNWTFEDGSVNMSRQADPMRLEEFLDAQIDSKNDALAIEFGTPDPATPGYNAAFEEAFGESSDGIKNVSDAINELTENQWVQKTGGVGTTPISETSEAADGLLESLEAFGIPVTYVAIRGIRNVFPLPTSPHK